MKKVYIVLIVLVFLGVAYYLGDKNSEIIYQPVKETVILDNLKAKVNQLKGELVLDIKNCESKGYKESDGLVTFDPNPKNKKVQIPSFGLYQFKVSTVQYYYKKFYNKDITGLEAINIALSEEKAGELAADVIFKDGALDNWYNCSKKNDSRAKLNVINSLLN